MISEHLFSRLDEVFLCLDEIVEVRLTAGMDDHESGYSLDWLPGDDSETIETNGLPGRHAAETASTHTGATTDNTFAIQGTDNMQQGDTEILFFDRYPRPQSQDQADHQDTDGEFSREDRDIIDVAVLSEN